MPATAKKFKKKNPHAFTTCIYRDNAAGEEEEIEVEVDFDFEGPDESVGIFGCSFDFNGAVRVDTGAAIELTKAEVERITERAEERAAENEASNYYDAMESRGDY
jgi:hypothetical protein